MTSSHYGLYGLGYTCATKMMTKRCYSVSLSKSRKVIALVRIVRCNSRTWSRNC